MKKLLYLFLIGMILNGCNPPKGIEEMDGQYVSENLIIQKISDHIYMHTTFLNTESFGKVPCNGMVVFDDDQAVVFDTPTSNEVAEELIHWLKDSLKAEITGVIATHFHEDCLGGLQAFHNYNIPSYANHRTIMLAKERQLVLPQNSFEEFLELNVGNQQIHAGFFGEGHTKDNIIGYFPAEKIMFGGCLIKEMNAAKGNLEDANLKDWSATVKKLKATYSQTAIVIPGHGELGGTELLDYTIKLFEQAK